MVDRLDRLRLLNERARLLETSADARQATPEPHRPLVLCGAGPLGQMTLAHLRRIGIEPAAVIDNDSRRWGALLDGARIDAPAEAVTRHARTASFVVTIYNGSAVRRQLAALGCTHVMHFADLFRRFPREFLPFCGIASRLTTLDSWDQAARAAALWCDARSETEYFAQLEWRLHLGECQMPVHDAADGTYFPTDLFRYLDDEVLFDCGAFDGDSIRQYLRRRLAGGRARIVGFEPDAATFARLSDFQRSLPPVGSDQFRIEPWAVADKTGDVRFTALGSVRSGVGDEGTVTAAAVALDDLGIAPTFIKMDVEGFELPALRGASGILLRNQPVLAISLYHHATDLWTIPNFIHALVPDYRLYLRRYAEDCWETVLYAVPAGRLPAGVAAPARVAS